MCFAWCRLAQFVDAFASAQKNDHGMSWWPKLKQQMDWGSWTWDHVVCFQVEGKRVSFKNCLTETLEVCKNIQTICNECNVYTVYTSFVLVCINYVHGVHAFHKMSRVAQSLSKRRSSAISATRSMRSWWFVAVNLSSSEIFFRATPCRHWYEMLRILHPIQFKCVLRQFPWNNAKILQNATVHLYPP